MTSAPAARPLSNLEVLRFIVRRWATRPAGLAAQVTLMLCATACDLAVPWAAGRLVDAVTRPGAREGAAAWAAWAALVAIYGGYYALRTAGFRVMNRFAASNMAEVVRGAFARVQRFSADWHADAFAGATVRKVSRAMAGYDEVSDALLITLGPTVLVLAAAVERIDEMPPARITLLLAPPRELVKARGDCGPAIESPATSGKNSGSSGSLNASATATPQMIG